MPELTLVHPDRARLAAFGRGLVKEEEIVEVGTHVAACEATATSCSARFPKTSSSDCCVQHTTTEILPVVPGMLPA